MDKDHNRSVVTFIGQPEEVIEAAFDAAKKAAEVIDMSTHQGEHPRLGATDVIPLIPISGITTEECIELSEKLGARIGEELGVSLYRYEKAASSDRRRDLADVSGGQDEGMKEKLIAGGWKPDYGPKELNVKAGVTAVGARTPLVAYNINLDTNNLDIANKIAKSIRAKGGGFTYCKAIGIEITERDIV